MKRMIYFAVALTVIAFSGSIQAEDGKGEEVVLDGLKSITPSSWVKQKPSSKLRAYQFQLPKGEGDADNADLAIFFFGPGSGGSVADNLKRWKGQFQAPKDKTIDEVAKVDTFKVGKVEVTYLDVKGTFLSRPPADPTAPAKPHPGYRRFGVIFASENGPYFLTVTGPEKTMAKHKKEFDHWLKNFK